MALATALGVGLRYLLNVFNFGGVKWTTPNPRQDIFIQVLNKTVVIHGNGILIQLVHGRFTNGRQVRRTIFFSRHGLGFSSMTFGNLLDILGRMTELRRDALGILQGGIILDVTHHDLDGISINKQPWDLWKGLLKDFNILGSDGLEFEKDALFLGVIGSTHHVHGILQNGGRLIDRTPIVVVTTGRFQCLRSRLGFTIGSVLGRVHTQQRIGDQGRPTAGFVKGNRGQIQNLGNCLFILGRNLISLTS
mmetsp:Transcript_25281/g.62259  ORF Transcript_25281/g.62259 Transcript_25281/m.62259 type:complete len:249 (+) Transcript_25281:485-1231(+)